MPQSLFLTLINYIQIRKGRHPLLDKKKAVPIDVRLGKDFDL